MNEEDLKYRLEKLHDFFKVAVSEKDYVLLNELIELEIEMEKLSNQ